MFEPNILSALKNGQMGMLLIEPTHVFPQLLNFEKALCNEPWLQGFHRQAEQRQIIYTINKYEFISNMILGGLWNRN